MSGPTSPSCQARKTPVWRQIAPELSGGYVEVHLALDCDHPDYPFDEVTSS